MAIATHTYTTPQTNRVLLLGQAERAIRVLQLVVTGDKGAKFKLLSDPGGPEQRDLTPFLHVSSTAPLVLRLGRRYALATPREHGLGLTSAYTGVEGELSLLFWYEYAS